MTDRHTADSITSDALDALYDDLDRYEEVLGDLNETLVDRAKQLGQAEELLRIAHETSNKSEAERARVAVALQEVLSVFRHVNDNADRTTVGYVSAPVRPADYDRWRAALNPPKEQPGA